MRRLLSALAVTSCLLAGLPVMTWAQSLPGLTLFSGVKSENQLPFRLDFGGQTNSRDRYISENSSEKNEIGSCSICHYLPKLLQRNF